MNVLEGLQQTREPGCKHTERRVRSRSRVTSNTLQHCMAQHVSNRSGSQTKRVKRGSVRARCCSSVWLQHTALHQWKLRRRLTIGLRCTQLQHKSQQHRQRRSRSYTRRAALHLTLVVRPALKDRMADFVVFQSKLSFVAVHSPAAVYASILRAARY